MAIRPNKRRASPQRRLADIVSLVRFAIGEVDALEPFDEVVNRRFTEWIGQQARANRHFSPEQMAWLQMIRDHIATSLRVEMSDLELSPFHDKGSPYKAGQVFGQT